MTFLITVVSTVLTVLIVTSLARRVGISAPLLLLIVGAAVSYLPFVNVTYLDPEIILVGFLPPLLYASAVNTSLVDFKTHFAPIGWLAVGAVLFTALVVALVVNAMLPVGLAVAFALGAVVAPPDAVAATAVARKVGFPRRIVTILEGESLINDATALVSLRTAITAMTAAITLEHVVEDFTQAAAIGILSGFLTAKFMTALYARIKHATTVTALTFLAPFIAFAGAEYFHASGVIAVVTAGLLLGHVTPVAKSSEARIATHMNWSTVQYVLEHCVFLLIGLQTKIILDDAIAYPIDNVQIVQVSVTVLVVVIAARILWVLVMRVARSRALRRPRMAESLLIGWAGMRGVVTLASAASLPLNTPYRPVLLVIAIVVTAGTLLIHGFSLSWLARKLDIRGPDPREDALQIATLSQHTSAIGMQVVRTLAQPGDERIVQLLDTQANDRIQGLWASLGTRTPDGRALDPRPYDRYRTLRLAAIEAERLEILKLRDKGQTDYEVLATLLDNLDSEESRLVRRIQHDRAIRSLPPADPGGGCVHLQNSSLPANAGSAGECLDCSAPEGSRNLRMCLTCGHIACEEHAAQHFQETGHAVVRSLEPGQSWRWCFVDELRSNN